MSTAAENINGKSTDSSQENATTVTSTAVTNGTDSKKEVPLKQLFEQSTQYNHWRYTQSALNQLRGKVNQEAIATIRQNIEEENQQRVAQGLPRDDSTTSLKFLTVDEELSLLGFYERRMAQIFRYWKLPSYVMATAIVYMKRFFLENTAMDYHPKDVMLTCMFLARKTENYLMTIEDFSNVIKKPAESILDLEFLVCKNLRFHFTVHHPYRPCIGFFYDMQAVTDNMKRLQKMHETAIKFIDTSLHTDLCFLYQPSQIALAAIRLACKEESYEFERYANYKFRATESAAQMYDEILLPILLAIEQVLTDDPRCKEVEKSVATEIDKRLKMCKDPAKNPESLIYIKRKRTEPNGDDDDDDDDDEDRPSKRTRLGEDGFAE
ncbi:hypothetical protein BGZ98_007550 [Dissophora globulifera]|nr:hypothetical protein BGZ98_007550 [Dissophora globulifera]